MVSCSVHSYQVTDTRRWNESFKFEASLKNARGDFFIHLWDYDLIGSDDWLGMVRIPLYSVVENPGVGIHAWLPLDMVNQVGVTYQFILFRKRKKRRRAPNKGRFL